jgi:hypothetical protein
MCCSSTRSRWFEDPIFATLEARNAEGATAPWTQVAALPEGRSNAGVCCVGGPKKKLGAKRGFPEIDSDPAAHERAAKSAL